MNAMNTITDKLLIHANKFGHQTMVNFISDKDQLHSLTYNEFSTRVLKQAAYIRSEVNKGDRVILCFEPGIDFIISFYACLFAGVIAVPCMPPLNQESAKRLNLIIKKSKSSLALTSSDLLSKFKTLNFINILDTSFTKPLYKLLSPLHRNIKLEGTFENWKAVESISSDIEKLGEIANTWDEPVFLQYTSGSTSLPKGVKVSMKNLCHNFEIIAHALDWKGEFLNTCSWLPPYHDLGLIGLILFTIYNGGTITLMSPLDFLKNPHKWIQLLSKFRITGTAAPNFAFELIARKMTDEQLKGINLSSLRYVINGAEPVRRESLEKFGKRLGISSDLFIPAYGLAEATLFVSGKKKQPSFKTLLLSKAAYQKGELDILNNDSTEEKVEAMSCGGFHPGTKVRIIDPDTLELAPPNKFGEICIYNESVTSGYWEEESDNLFQPSWDSIKFLRSGDLGFVYEDELYIVGRIKDLIIINGKNYYPQDIELVVEKSHPAIKPGCTAAFSIVGDISEELIVVAESKEIDKDNSIKESIQKNLLANFQLTAKEIVLIKPRTLLKTTSGKVRRRETKNLYLNKQLQMQC